MPWRERSPVDLRVQFISEYQTGLWSMTELTDQYGISRKTGYKWVERSETGGTAALRDQSRRPQTQPTATARALVDALVAIRRRHPSWGAKKLLAVAGQQAPAAAWPSRSTVCDLLRREGLVVPRPRRPRRPHGGHALSPILGLHDT
jgi:putative transposase